MQLLARRLTHGQQDVVPVIVAQPVQRGQPVANRGPDPDGTVDRPGASHLPRVRGTDVCQLISLRQARRRSYRRARFSTAANPAMRRGDDQNPSALPAVLRRQLAAPTARADTRPPSPCASSQSPDTATSIWLWDSVPQCPARRF